MEVSFPSSPPDDSLPYVVAWMLLVGAACHCWAAGWMALRCWNFCCRKPVNLQQLRWKQHLNFIQEQENLRQQGIDRTTEGIRWARDRKYLSSSSEPRQVHGEEGLAALIRRR